MLGASIPFNGETCIILEASEDPMLREYHANRGGLSIEKYIDYTIKSSLGVECVMIKHQPHCCFYKVTDEKKWIFTILRLGIVLS